MKRRYFMKTAGIAGAGLVLLPGFSRRGLFAEQAMLGLSDPALQPKFVNLVPDALSPGFIYKPHLDGVYRVKTAKAKHFTGLINPTTGKALIFTPTETPRTNPESVR